ncbi:CubicO group peptidase (beta-lactamase class C family) [Ichthyenterobacterium magnum]|uniref:CubicO group peptidase (Beta-lactamase class C family) n=2 Tax=Ichthyenterobacterium magnum TaxID=1230530 RepID=A0A420DKT9_9FLAO|nr:CubicO group peptidase (beta-lactamase class C family) [Ichthyenterobacterium magnum]
MISATIFSQTFPDTEWAYNMNAYKEGWSDSKGKELYKYIVDSTNITSMLIVHKGKVVYQYGDVKQNTYIASCRKSVLSMLYGKYVENGTIRLNETIKTLGIDDVDGVLPIEQKATIKDLISSRSGIYRRASNPGTWVKYLKKRGTVEPGTRWLYNNWDFNVAGFIFESKSKKNIYDAVRDELALPLQMEDWNRTIHKKSGDVTRSKYLGYPMWFSSRDLARLGLLMLNKGKWKNKQIIPENWVNEMITPRTTAKEMQKSVPVMNTGEHRFAYGYMWWLWENHNDWRLKDAYSALGAYGQNITILPEIDAVIVFNTKPEYGRFNNGKITQELPARIVKIYDESE